MSTQTTNFEMTMPGTSDTYDISTYNTNLQKIDTEMAKPPLTVNNTSPNASRNIQIDTVPLADNLVSDESQVITGDFILRASGGDASISNGTANLSSVMGNMVKTGYVEQFIGLEVIPYSTSEITATINEATLVAYMNSSGEVTFTYSTSWSPDVTNYGITVSGTPDAGDKIVLTYVKGNRGTITVAAPVKLISTGWNLYNHSVKYARVPKYSDSYGFMIEGSYSTVKFSTTLNGSKTTITPVSGHFTIPNDGYVHVTGGNSTNTAIYMTWGDWTDGTPETFQAYTQDEIDLSGIMVNFPNGLMRVGNVADELNFNTHVAYQRIGRLSYSAENLATVEASGLPYDTDENYIYYVLSEATTYDIASDFDSAYTANDHGTELFTGTTIPTYATVLYGQDLAGKLRRDVVTISPMDLSPEQKAQVRNSIGAVSTDILNGMFRYDYKKLLSNVSISANGYTVQEANMPTVSGYTPLGIVGYRISGANSTYVSVFRECYFNTSGKIEIGLKNCHASQAASVTVEIWILYAKNA